MKVALSRVAGKKNPWVILAGAPKGNAGAEGALRGYMPILSLLLLAFALRLVSAVFLTGDIGPEGAEYGRIAENLLSGRGYYGIAAPGTELMFPPFFPYLIACASLLTGDTETGGRLVSVVMGTMLVLPIFLLTRQLFSERAGYVAAGLTAVHPYLVTFSASVYCEATYLTLVLIGVFATVRGFHASTYRIFLVAGMAFGLAYLTRPEAAIYQVLAVGFTVIYCFLTDRQNLWKTSRRLALGPVAFLCLAGPYILWHHAHTGQWRLEGKSPLNFTVGRDMLDGVEPQYAQYGVDADLNERGVWMKSNFSTIDSTSITLQDLFHYLRRKAGADLGYLKGLPTHTSFGAPPLLLLALYGLFRRPWNKSRAVSNCFLGVVLAVAGSALAFNYYYSDRFLLLFIPIFIVWASHGIFELARWAMASVRMTFGRSWAPLRYEGVIVVALAAVIPAITLPVVYRTAQSNRSTQAVQAAGEWLKAYAPEPKTVMDLSTLVPFHAGAEFVPFPYADSDVAIRYLDKREVDFIVLSEFNRLEFRPYLGDWMENGPPSERAKLVWSNDAPNGRRIAIYSWAPAGSNESAEASQDPAALSF